MAEAPPSSSNHADQHGVDAGRLRAGPILALPSVLESLGVRPAPVLAEFSLDVSFFADPENTLPMAVTGRLLDRCAERTGCGHFGLLVGERAGTSAVGTLGFLMQNSESVGEALSVFVRHFPVHDRGGTATVEREGGVCVLTYSLVVDSRSAVQILSCAMAIGANIMRDLCGAQWQPSGVTFAFSEPEDVEPYRQFFGVRPRFDAKRTGIAFPARLLHLPIPGRDALLRKLMERRLREIGTPADDFVSRLRGVLRSLVTSPSCSVEAASTLMGVHRRTLNRELAAAGTTFRELRDEARRELACHLLQDTRVGASEIATTLGYTDPASFTRAFKRWTGTTPTGWRRERGGAARCGLARHPSSRQDAQG